MAGHLHACWQHCGVVATKAQAEERRTGPGGRRLVSALMSVGEYAGGDSPGFNRALFKGDTTCKPLTSDGSASCWWPARSLLVLPGPGLVHPPRRTMIST